MKCIALFLLLAAGSGEGFAAEPLPDQIGRAGASGWRCNVIQLDPHDDGPDGFNHWDWDGDGDLDVFVNFEEGGYSRLFFNPGREQLRSTGNWVKMTLFEQEARCPVVWDLDGDSLKDLIVGASVWYKQPTSNKHEAASWERYELGEAKWAMSCIITDMDGDGDDDILVQERRQQGTFYFANPGKGEVTKPWPVKVIDSRQGGMFMAVGDVNGDGREDLVKAANKICIFLRTNDKGAPVYKRIEVEQPAQPVGVDVKPRPKGVALLEMNGEKGHPEIVIIPEYAAQLWYLTMSGDGMSAADWANTLMDVPSPESRKKMDNTFLVDLDADGDLDIATTEENGGWGVIWFENPAMDKAGEENASDK